MSDFFLAFKQSLHLLMMFDNDLLEIIRLSFYVSCSSLIISCIIGLPTGCFLAISNFKGRNFLVIFIQYINGISPRCCRFINLYYSIK